MEIEFNKYINCVSDKVNKAKQDYILAFIARILISILKIRDANYYLTGDTLESDELKLKCRLGYEDDTYCFELYDKTEDKEIFDCFIRFNNPVEDGKREYNFTIGEPNSFRGMDLYDVYDKLVKFIIGWCYS